METLFYLPLLLRLVIAEPALPPGSPAPTVVVQRLGGKEERLHLKGHPHLLLFFATWCRRCPQYVGYLAHARDLRARGVEFVPIDLLPSELPGDAQALWRRLGSPGTLYLDRYGQTAEAYQVTELPMAVLIGKDGRIVGELVGARSRKDVQRLLQRLG